MTSEMPSARWPSGSLQAAADRMVEIVLGKPDVVALSLVCLLAEGHLLLQDLPGVGKTTLATALARTVGLDLRRVQGTADLLPSDVTGSLVPGEERGQLVFRPGPIFAHLVVADELNRASPRAQSALLEAMEERHVTVDGTTHPLPRPFMVIATQNPLDPDSTFLLPHSQRDRFLLCLSIGYPDRASEAALLDAGEQTERADALSPVLAPGELAAAIEEARRVHLSEATRDYALDLVHGTRHHHEVAVGASPRAALALVRAARARALFDGRDYVLPDDVKALAVPVLAHRLVLAPSAELAGRSASVVVGDILTGTSPAPPRRHR